MEVTLTLALGIFHGGFEAGGTGAGADRNHPLAVPVAVELERDGHLHGVGHAVARGDDQRGGLSTRGRLRENGEVGDGGGALFVENSDRDERHAGAQVLEGQVEAGLGQRTEAADLRVDLA